MACSSDVTDLENNGYHLIMGFRHTIRYSLLLKGQKFNCDGMIKRRITIIIPAVASLIASFCLVILTYVQFVMQSGSNKTKEWSLTVPKQMKMIIFTISSINNNSCNFVTQSNADFLKILEKFYALCHAYILYENTKVH